MLPQSLCEPRRHLRRRCAFLQTLAHRWGQASAEGGGGGEKTAGITCNLSPPRQGGIRGGEGGKTAIVPALVAGASRSSGPRGDTPRWFRNQP